VDEVGDPRIQDAGHVGVLPTADLDDGMLAYR
jgi:hypothetical protein